MRFMIIIKATQDSEAGAMPSEDFGEEFTPELKEQEARTYRKVSENQ
ncbi:hypothetical protein [Sulfuriflexus sp.]|nr:hypothetical protein [Sulfuriflexus sp.]MDT8405058.1 hypothetical protein [Sulfuriflexus sp.]